MGEPSGRSSSQALVTGWAGAAWADRDSLPDPVIAARQRARLPHRFAGLQRRPPQPGPEGVCQPQGAVRLHLGPTWPLALQCVS